MVNYRIDGLEQLILQYWKSSSFKQKYLLPHFNEGHYPGLNRLINDQLIHRTICCSDLVTACRSSSLISHTDKNNIATLSVSIVFLLLSNSQKSGKEIEERSIVENYERYT